MNWKKIVPLFSTAAIFSLVCPIQTSASTGAPPGDLTQREYLELLAKASARTASLPANPTAADYVKWAVARGIMPEGGWQPDAPLTRKVYAQTLAQLYGVSAQADPVRALVSEGVVVPSTDLISRTTVLQELGDFGFRSVTALTSHHPGTPVEPEHHHDHDHDHDNDKTTSTTTTKTSTTTTSTTRTITRTTRRTIVVTPAGPDPHRAREDCLAVCR